MSNTIRVLPSYWMPPCSKLITRTMNLEGTRPRADTECPTARYAGQPSNLSWGCTYVHYSRVREVGGHLSQLSSLDVYRRLSPHGCAFHILALLVICPRTLSVYADCCVGGKNHIAFESMFNDRHADIVVFAGKAI